MNVYAGCFFPNDALWSLTWRRSGSDELLVSFHGRLLSATQPIQIIYTSISLIAVILLFLNIDSFS